MTTGHKFQWAHGRVLGSRGEIKGECRRKWTEFYRAEESRLGAILAILPSCGIDKKRHNVHSEIHSDCLQINRMKV